MVMQGDKQMRNAKENRIETLKNRISAAWKAMDWCRANGRSQGPASREIAAAIAELKQIAE